jgi:hypothetical protein
MTYTFGSVDIIAFDIHTAIKPLAFPQFLKPEFKFLADGRNYNQQYELWQAVGTGEFAVHPVKKREFTRNHFWKHYAGMSFGVELDFWGLQIPFVFEPKDFDLQVNMDGLAFQVEVEPVIYLNSTGWSSNLKLKLTGQLNASEVQEFVGRLRGLNQSQLPFVVSGANQRLTSVFKALGWMVRKGIYDKPDTVGDVMTVSNQLIISLADATATPKYFNEEWGLTPFMDDDERAQVLGMLYGDKINAGAPAEVKRYQDSTLVTRFRDTNFSLTNYRKGTLLYMQEQGAKGLGKMESLSCLASNVRSCTMMTHFLLEFAQAAGKISGPSSMVEALQERAQSTLTLLPDFYHNAYSRNFYLHHDRIKKVLHPEGADNIPF